MEIMKTRRWDPMLFPFGKGFEDFFPGAEAMEFAPPLDLREVEDAFILNVELPGMKKEDINVTCENGVLRITGEKKLEETQKTGEFHRLERRFGRFIREVSLGREANVDMAEAMFKEGILSVRLPKMESAKPKRIELD